MSKPYQDLSDLEQHLPWCRDTIVKMTKDGRLPAGTMVGGKLVWKWASVAERMDALLGAQPTEAETIERVRHATRKVVNGR